MCPGRVMIKYYFVGSSAGKKRLLKNYEPLRKLFFFVVSLADDSTFIFPKKKIITINDTEKNYIDVKKNNENKTVNLPQKKPIKRDVKKQKKIIV